MKQVVQEKILFKYISYLEHWQLLSSVGWNHLCSFVRGHYEEHFHEILNLDQWFSRCCLKILLI